jgi:phenylacetate-CoA ligase
VTEQREGTDRNSTEQSEGTTTHSAERREGSAGRAVTRWLTRDDLGAAGGGATGLLLVSPDASSVFPLGPADRAAAAALTGEALKAAGIGERDRVVVALSEPYGTLWAQAAADVAAAAASAGPRGRLRLHHTLESLRATTLVITPTGAMDFLARLHLEFLLDPLDLGLRNIVLAGEIASRRTLSHLAAEFDATVTEVFASPFSGGALAWRSAETAPLTPLTDGVLGLASLDKDSSSEGSAGLAELVITPFAHSTLGDAVLRTGHVARLTTPGEIPAPAHTVGDHILVKGVWLSLSRLERALAKIDGVSTWELAVARQGTLDSATLTVTFNRESLIRNPMWKSRIEQSVRALTPVALTVKISGDLGEAPRPGTVNDLRGHHLGRDRTAISH